MTTFVKIVFALEPDDDGFPPIGSEALNARVEPDGFVLENTPFFATGVALGDRVEASPMEHIADKLTFQGVIESSTNLAISIIFIDPMIQDQVYRELKQVGCYCEYGEFGRGKELQMLAVAIPGDCDYEAIAGRLTEYEQNEQLSFAELAVWDG